jgi:cytochrome bd-type quinol oxidase subunit 2
MIHPLIKLVATRPELVADHLSAYAALIGSEAREAQSRWTVRLLLVALALCCVGVTAVLAGVALMLWAVTPSLQSDTVWALWAAPALPAVVAVVAGMIARRPATEPAFAAVQQQFEADARMLGEVGTT